MFKGLQHTTKWWKRSPPDQHIRLPLFLRVHLRCVGTRKEGTKNPDKRMRSMNTPKLKVLKTNSIIIIRTAMDEKTGPDCVLGNSTKQPSKDGLEQEKIAHGVI